MISDQTLDAAVAHAVITADQAAALRSIEGAVAPAAFGEDEKLRLVTGFGDIFVTIGLLLFLGALSYFAQAFFGAVAMGICGAAASWALAEFFTRRRRMALPSIVLLVTFAGFVLLATSIAVETRGSLTASTWSAWPALDNGLTLIVSGLVTAALVGLHYWRFHVPITVAAGAAALVAVIFGLEAVLTGTSDLAIKPTLFVCGIAIFAAAMAFDMSDPQRVTRRTDIAFWLHLLAAPLIVHTLVGGLVANGALTQMSAIAILAIFLGLAVVAVLIDRRAVLVSGLSYAGYAFGTLAVKVGATEVAIPLTILLLGAVVLMLSAGWHALRGAILPMLPDGLARRLPRTYMGGTRTEYQA